MILQRPLKIEDADMPVEDDKGTTTARPMNFLAPETLVLIKAEMVIGFVILDIVDAEKDVTGFENDI